MARRSYTRSRSYERRGRNDSRGYQKRQSRSRSPRGYRGGGPPPNSENQVYVARFSKHTTESDLKKAFERYGYIDKVDIKEFRGFGFIVSATINLVLKRLIHEHHQHFQCFRSDGCYCSGGYFDFLPLNYLINLSN